MKDNITRVVHLVNEDSGEIISTTKRNLYREGTYESGYIMFYAGGLDLFIKCWRIDQQIYYNMCFHYGYRDSFRLTTDFKTLIKNNYNVKDSSISKSLRRLTDSSLLLRCGGRGEYRINPIYSFRGDLRTRERLIRQHLFEKKQS
jgi:hypothetical protein